MCTAAVILAIYFPAGWLVLHVATPQRLLLESPPFAAGDVLLCNPSAYWRSDPRPGDVVLFDVPMHEVRLPPAARFVLPNVPANVPVFANVGGLGIERLLAAAGAKVQWKAGQLTVNGRPSAWRP